MRETFPGPVEEKIPCGMPVSSASFDGDIIYTKH